MHKAGDKFEVVSGGADVGVSYGDIVTWVGNGPCDVGYFKSSSGFEFPAVYGKNIFNIHTTVRPLRTEAEKRGAKFGDRVVFVDPPKDMVGDFGVVTDVECPDEYGVTYNDGSGSNRVWLAPDKIKPYEAA